MGYCTEPPARAPGMTFSKIVDTDMARTNRGHRSLLWSKICTELPVLKFLDLILEWKVWFWWRIIENEYFIYLINLFYFLIEKVSDHVHDHDYNICLFICFSIGTLIVGSFPSLMNNFWITEFRKWRRFWPLRTHVSSELNPIIIIYNILTIMILWTYTVRPKFLYASRNNNRLLHGPQCMGYGIDYNQLWHWAWQIDTLFIILCSVPSFYYRTSESEPLTLIFYRWMIKIS